ncbi:GTP-binding protein HflX [Alkalihalobacillus xiaoxiensis]|uniref:GTPase HflX n=1 Tax=Shouchella xiaoxiensis TaxID=766895 RepID=A0ABS2ST63_9BACI|nr:GTPase HflX [Shouchella xiaoxiensis]MBM7838686.1 GTP-binding protein HflX [Shouchella xiaoxiensis]
MHEQQTRKTVDTIIIGVEKQQDVDFSYSMKELTNLTEALDLRTVAQVSQKLTVPNQATYIGSGKVSEIKMMCEEMDVSLVIFNDELTPSQIRNLEKLLEVTVYDRTMLILDIFGERAKTKEAQMQVEVARLKYLLPRLVGMRASLSRQGGSGTGLANRGAGETKLELDRRKIESRINMLEKELESIVNRRDIQRSQRKKQQMPVVALVGYTNAGKSSLLNAMLTDDQEKHVFEKDMLFATLDTSVRRVEWKKNLPFLMADTVGFVSKLPTHLVKAFRSTLEEAREADLLLHVVDYSHEYYKEMIETTTETLKSMDIEQPMVFVYNKIDLTDENEPRTQANELFVSASKKLGLNLLADAIQASIFKEYRVQNLLIPYDEGAVQARINEQTHVIKQEEREEGWFIKAFFNEQDRLAFERFL